MKPPCVGNDDEKKNTSGPTNCLGFYKLEVNPASVDPRRKLEQSLEALAGEIRDVPTVPADALNAMEPRKDALSTQAAVQLPAKHCAFLGCVETFECEEALLNHVHDVHYKSEGIAGLHRPLLEGSCKNVHDNFKETMKYIIIPVHDEVVDRPERLGVASIYNEAIGIKVRLGAPVATLAIDRRALYNYTQGLGDDKVASLICWCCARRYPYVEGRKNE
jgi:hypothetical protein